MDSHHNEIQIKSFFSLYRYLNKSYVALMIIGVTNCMIAGASCLYVMFNLQITVSRITNDSTPSENKHTMNQAGFRLLGCTGVQLVSCFIFFMCFHLVGQKICYEVKSRYMKALLVQESSWYDAQDLEKLPTIVHTNLSELENSAGKNVGFVIYSMSCFISGVVYSFLCGAVLATTFIANILFVLIAGGIQNRTIERVNRNAEENYIECGAYAEEALNAIKIVKAFGQEHNEISKYEKRLRNDEKNHYMHAISYGLSMGLTQFAFVFCMTYIWFIGGIFVAEKITNKNFDRVYRPGDVIGAYFCIQTGTNYLAFSFMNIQALKRGIEATKSIFKVIDRKPQIDVCNKTLDCIEQINENIIFDNISFKYINRNKLALDKVSFTIEKGKTTALVGESGSGKSTVVKLLERFYDPEEGNILINGKDLKTLNLRQYRRLVSYVGQEPKLFNESIKENLLNANPEASDYEIEAALKNAFAYDFVQKLPEGINTNVGAIGGILSGGQKQRIALSRALIRNPQLLILDEATSALDKKSEEDVQRAIDNIKSKYSFTIVMIAHRLSTIQNSDKIIVFKEGKI